MCTGKFRQDGEKSARTYSLKQRPFTMFSMRDWEAEELDCARFELKPNNGPLPESIGDMPSLEQLNGV